LGAIGEPLREMASALVDGEAGEFETRRLLEQADQPGLRALIGRHYTVRTLLRHEADQLCPPALTRSILDALDAEVAHRGAVALPRWRGLAGGAAVAASVCFAVVLGTRFLAVDTAATGPQLAAVGNTLGTLGNPPIRPVTVAGGAVPVGLPAGINEDADGIARKRLELFMMYHAENSALNTPDGMMPYARVVSYDEP